MKALRKINKLRFLKARRAAIVEMAKKGDVYSTKAVKNMINAQLKAPEVALKRMKEEVDYKWKV